MSILYDDVIRLLYEAVMRILYVDVMTLLYMAFLRILYDDILLKYLEMYTFRPNEDGNSRNRSILYLGGKKLH